MCLSFTTRPPRPWQALESKSVGGLWKPLLQSSWVSWSRGRPETSFLASFPGIQMLWLRSHLEKRWMTNPSGCCSFLAPWLEWYRSLSHPVSGFWFFSGSPYSWPQILLHTLLGAGQASSGCYPPDWCPRKSHRAAKEPQANVGGLLCSPIK